MKNRDLVSSWWAMLVLAALTAPAPARGDQSAHLYNAQLKQVTTSSSLKWTGLNKEFMRHYIVGATTPQGPIYLCRARHEGDMLLGQLRPEYSSCAVSGSKSYDVFEVLENIENASLIIWKPWFRFHGKPNGGVVVYPTGDHVFVGRIKAAGKFSHNVGRISFESDLGQMYAFDEQNNDIMETTGEVLVEVEPLRYEIDNVELDLKTEHVRYLGDPVTIEERVLRNNGPESATDTTEIEYKFNYSLSWGHGHGIGIGLETDITMADGTTYRRIRWNTPFSEERKELYKLEKYLEPGTACNVTIIGNYTTRDVQYTGKLTTFYKDNDSRSRNIRAERIVNTFEVEAIYGEVYFVGNNSLVPTTTTTTTTSTTTTTTTTTPPPPLEENEISPEKPESIEMLSDSSEGGKAPTKDTDIKSAVVGGLGSKPNTNSASASIFSLALLIPMFSLIL